MKTGTNNKCIYCQHFDLFVGNLGFKKSCSQRDPTLINGNTDGCKNEFKELQCQDCQRHLSLCDTCPNK